MVELAWFLKRMIKAHRITPDTLERLAPLYQAFCEKAYEHYKLDHDPIPFEQLKGALAERIIEGYWVEDTAVADPIAFMLYRLEDHRAIEINVLYTEVEDKKTILDRLVRQFIEDNRTTEGWDVVSWAMLGDQEAFVRTVTWYGFKPVGQAILKFNFMDTISLQILKQQQLEPLPPGYTLDTWKPEYAGEVAISIFEAFEQAADAKWDPRFASEMGARKVVGLITSGAMGKFHPDCTTVVLKDGVPVGFCFLVQSGAAEGNIPVIGVRPSEKKKGLATHLLKGMVERAIDAMLASKIDMLEITTTMDTDNIPAIKLYRRLGFREEYNYPHVYLTREKLLAYQSGVWC